jgi:hypothetical protein
MSQNIFGLAREVTNTLTFIRLLPFYHRKEILDISLLIGCRYSKTEAKSAEISNRVRFRFARRGCIRSSLAQAIDHGAAIVAFDLPQRGRPRTGTGYHNLPIVDVHAQGQRSNHHTLEYPSRADKYTPCGSKDE